MNSHKTGTVFIVLMVALVAYGVGSFAYAMDLGGDTIQKIIPSNFTLFSQQQLTEIGDPSFKPVKLVEKVVVNTTPNRTSNNTDGNGTIFDILF
jgi:hypothetical protein